MKYLQANFLPLRKPKITNLKIIIIQRYNNNNNKP